MKDDETKHHILYLLQYSLINDRAGFKPMTIKVQCPKFIFKFLKCVCVCVCYRARDVCPRVGDAE